MALPALLVLSLFVGSRKIDQRLGAVLVLIAAMVQVAAILSTFKSIYGAFLCVACLGMIYLYVTTVRSRREEDSKETKRRAFLIVVGICISQMAIAWQLYQAHDLILGWIYVLAWNLGENAAVTSRPDYTFENCSIHLKRPFFRPIPAKVGGSQAQA